MIMMLTLVTDRGSKANLLGDDIPAGMCLRGLMCLRDGLCGLRGRAPSSPRASRHRGKNGRYGRLVERDFRSPWLPLISCIE